MKEQLIQSQILNYLKARSVLGDLWFKKIHIGPIQVGNGRKAKNPLAGHPDILICLRGRYIVVEVKKPGEKATQDQLEVHAALKKAGAIVLVADNVDLVMELIRQLDLKEG